MPYQLREIYIPYAGATGLLLHINGKLKWKNWNHLFCRKVSFVKRFWLK